MRAKMLAVGLALGLMGLAMMGCPPSVNVTASQTQNAVDSIKSAMESLGYKVRVEAKDVNRNGTIDIYVTYLSGNENDENNDLMFLGGVTGAVGAVKGLVDYEIDMAYAKFGPAVYHATSADCAKCVAMIGHATDVEIGTCGMGIWSK
jgi:hypothetical protein